MNAKLNTMTKTANTTDNLLFHIGDRVCCDLPTGTATGTLTAINKGWYVVENHSNGQNEYAMTAIQVAQVRRVLHSWRTGVPASSDVS